MKKLLFLSLSFLFLNNSALNAMLEVKKRATTTKVDLVANLQAATHVIKELQKMVRCVNVTYEHVNREKVHLEKLKYQENAILAQLQVGGQDESCKSNLLAEQQKCESASATFWRHTLGPLLNIFLSYKQELKQAYLKTSPGILAVCDGSLPNMFEDGLKKDLKKIHHFLQTLERTESNN